MILKITLIPAVVALALTGAGASAAPMAPLAGVASAQDAPVTVQFRGGNWRDHPLMYPGYWWEHQRQWDAFEGRGPYARVPRCASLRGYDPTSHTYVNRNGRRVRCR